MDVQEEINLRAAAFSICILHRGRFNNAIIHNLAPRISRDECCWKQKKKRYWPLRGCSLSPLTYARSFFSTPRMIKLIFWSSFSASVIYEYP